MKDLVVLVADIQQQKTIDVLLSKRYNSLNIPQLNFEIFRHPWRDGGIYHKGGDFLSVLRTQYRYALVVLDKEWGGSPNDQTKIANKVQNDLNNNGWLNKSAVIVINPELEVWVWSNSPHVYNLLGMNQRDIKELGERKGYWQPGQNKPARPKELLEEVLFLKRERRSSALFVRLAQRVGFESCRDPSFQQLKVTLVGWFS